MVKTPGGMEGRVQSSMLRRTADIVDAWKQSWHCKQTFQYLWRANYR
jgi:hypothetical protein